jgi:hypothetical protein
MENPITGVAPGVIMQAKIQIHKTVDHRQGVYFFSNLQKETNYGYRSYRCIERPSRHSGKIG